MQGYSAPVHRSVYLSIVLALACTGEPEVDFTPTPEPSCVDEENAKIPAHPEIFAGDSGTLVVGTVTATSVELSWTGASNLAPPKPSGISFHITSGPYNYRIYYSTADNIRDIATALCNGTPAGEWQPAITTATASSLASGTNYFFNVIAERGGDKAAYKAISQTTN